MKHYESKQVNMRWPVDLLVKATAKASGNYKSLSQYVFDLVVKDLEAKNKS